MKIILLGKNGLLGSEFLRLLESLEGFDVEAYGHEECDVSNEADLKRVLNGSGARYVINCTAYTAVDQAEDGKEAAFGLNADAVNLMAQICKDNDIRLIHFSTDYVFDGQSKKIWKEDDVRNPINVYGESKAKGEEFLENSGCDYIVVRTAWLFGEFGKNFVDTMIALGKEKDSLNIVGDQFGSPTYARDLASAVVERFLQDEVHSSGIYHLTNSGSCSWCEFAKEIFELADIDVVVNKVSSAEFIRPAKRPMYSVLANEKLTPMRSWKSALKEYIDLRF